jgi:hypothetical protein
VPPWVRCRSLLKEKWLSCIAADRQRCRTIGMHVQPCTPRSKHLCTQLAELKNGRYYLLKHPAPPAHTQSNCTLTWV